MKRYFIFRKNNFFKYYFFIIFCFLLIQLGMFQYIVTSEQNKVIQNNSVIIQQLKENMNHQISTAKRYVVQLSISNYLKSFYVTRNKITPSMRYKYIETGSELAKEVISNEFISDIYLYILQNNILISPNGYYKISDPKDCKKESHYFKNYLEELQTIHKTPCIYQTSDLKKEIMVLYSLPHNSTKTAKVNLGLKINKNYIQALVNQNQEITRLNALFLVTDDTNNILYSNLLSAKDWNQLKSKHNSGYVSLNNRDYYMYKLKSDEIGINYIMLLSKDQIHKSVLNIKILLLLLILFTLTIIFIIIFEIKRKQYDPIKSTVKLLQIDDQPNYMSLLESTVHNKLVQSENVKKQSDYCQQNLLDFFIIRLLDGGLDKDKAKKIITYYNLQLNYHFFKVIGFYQVSSAATEMDSSFLKIIEGMNQNFSNFFKEKNVNFSSYTTMIHGMYVTILNYDSDCGFYDWLTNLQAELKEKNMILPISKTKTHYTELTYAYNEIREILEYMLVYGELGLFQITQTKRKSNIIDIKFYQYEENINRLLEAKEYDKAKNVIYNLFHLVLSEQQTNLTLVKCRIYGIINLLINHVDKACIPSDFIDFTRLLNKLTTSTNINDYCQELTEIIDKLNQYAGNTLAVDSDQLIDSIEKYIENNYCNEYLNVSFLADLFNIDITIISKKFKSKKGINLSDYIHRKRICFAKEQLKSTSLPIKEIAIQCGYLNSDNFIRVFRRYEGITPGKYRTTNFT